MHQYEWDAETGGILLRPQQSKSSNEPRPVYYREMNILHMDERWSYPQDDEAPIMWAESEKYIYRGRIVARTKGGSLYNAPEVIYTESEDGEPKGSELIPVDLQKMIKKNRQIMDTLVEDTVKKIYSTYKKYSTKIDLFYVAFSGGKDSVVALDMVQRTLPHDAFKVVFGDTQMEFPDTYENVKTVEKWCGETGIDFRRAKSKLTPKQTWACFGPPAAEVRWCCSVHKTTPQILLLREITGKPDFTGMAFTGIRGDESATRSKYDDVSEGKKHSGQYSYHVIFEWNSAELFLHIFANHLPIGDSYFKGIPRAGCLVCPNAIGRSDYFRRYAYTTEIDEYLKVIQNTSIKRDSFSDSQMREFVEKGYWRTRRTGRELVFGKDLFRYQKTTDGQHCFTILQNGFYAKWVPWLKTIGDIVVLPEHIIKVSFDDNVYELRYETGEDGYEAVKVANCFRSKSDVKFLSLVRSTVIKAIYCISCGVCEAECKNNCLHCGEGISIGENCKHCHQCHEVHERCVRYYSIRNKESEDQAVGKIDRYASFGFRGSWLESYVNHGGDSEFWISDADGLAPNKRQDACHQFMSDAGLIVGKWKNVINKETKEKFKDFSSIQITKLMRKFLETGSDNAAAWAAVLINLISNPDVPTFRWLIHNCVLFQPYEEEELYEMLIPAFANDEKGHGKQNVIDSLKVILATTPLGTKQILASADITSKSTARGDTLTLNSITRMPWISPTPEAILYGLYKFAESCGDYYQFTLSYLMDETIEHEGVSPTTIFGIDRDTMVKLLNGLAINYPDYLSVSFSFDLDTITLRKDKKSEDIIDLL